MNLKKQLLEANTTIHDLELKIEQLINESAEFDQKLAEVIGVNQESFIAGYEASYKHKRATDKAMKAWLQYALEQGWHS